MPNMVNKIENSHLPSRWIWRSEASDLICNRNFGFVVVNSSYSKWIPSLPGSIIIRFVIHILSFYFVFGGAICGCWHITQTFNNNNYCYFLFTFHFPHCLWERRGERLPCMYLMLISETPAANDSIKKWPLIEYSMPGWASFSVG